MVAALLKAESVQISRHEVPVDIKDYSFKNDFVKKNGLDVMVIRTQEKISDEILYKVKKIMNDVYSLSVPMKEVDMKNDVLAFFNKKKEFLSNLKIRYSSKSFAGSGTIPSIYADLDAITRTSDTATIFNEIITRKNNLEDNADILEQLESFYKDGSSQKKVFDEAVEICKWYDDNNTIFADLGAIADTITAMNTIIRMPVPFSKMTELGNLVFQANGIKDQILQEKFDNAIRSINNDKAEIKKEVNAALTADISDTQKAKIQDKYDEIDRTYNSWNNTISKKTTNLDSYVLSSQNTVKSFKKFVASVLAEKPVNPADPTNLVTPTVVRRKTLRVIDCVPVAKKRIKSKDDIPSVLEYIKAELEKALISNDEIDLD